MDEPTLTQAFDRIDKLIKEAEEAEGFAGFDTYTRGTKEDSPDKQVLIQLKELAKNKDYKIKIYFWRDVSGGCGQGFVPCRAYE